jgi:hypothetical protein
MAKRPHMNRPSTRTDGRTGHYLGVMSVRPVSPGRGHRTHPPKMGGRVRPSGASAHKRKLC